MPSETRFTNLSVGAWSRPYNSWNKSSTPESDCYANDGSYMYLTDGSGTVYQAVALDWPDNIASVSAMSCYGIWRHYSSGLSDHSGLIVWSTSSAGGWSYDAAGDGQTSWQTSGAACGSFPPAADMSKTSNAAYYRVGGRAYGNVGSQAHHDQAYITMTYTLLPKGFITFFIWPLIGTLLFQSDMIKYFNWLSGHSRNRTVLVGEEVDQAWRELKEHRFPTYHFPGLPNGS